MKNKLFVALIGLIVLSAFNGAPRYFTGRIDFVYSFQDAQGKDITAQMAALVGGGQQYFVDEGNYKSFTDKGRFQQLYRSDSNIYYQGLPDQSIRKIDASSGASQVFTVKKLADHETIAGYDCEAVEINTDDGTTTYYYSEKIKLNPSLYKRHAFGDWNRILEATGGALPLKFEMINMRQGFIVWTATATSVKAGRVSGKEFEVPEGNR